MFGFLKKLLNKFKAPPLLHIAFDYGNRNNKTIVLLHGIAADSNTWNYLLTEINTDEYRVVAMDLLGCGKSPRPKDIEYNVDDFVKSVRRTIRKARIKGRFIIMGHSMGALIAARYGRLYPENIDSEYLLSIPVYHKNEELHTNKSRRQTDLFLRAYDFMIKNKNFTVFTFQIARQVIKLFNRQMNMRLEEDDWLGFSLSLKNTIIHQNVISDLKNTRKRIKVNVIYGSLDELLVQDNVNHLSVLPNVTVTKINGVDHLINVKFAKKVIEILTQ